MLQSVSDVVVLKRLISPQWFQFYVEIGPNRDASVTEIEAHSQFYREIERHSALF